MSRVLTKLVLLIFLNGIGLSLQANRFGKDRLIIETDTVWISFIPLDDTLQDLIKTKSSNLSDCLSLQCVDGYRIWELRNDSLFLNQLLNCCGDVLLNKDSLNILHQEFDKGQLFMSSITTNLYHQYGQLLASTHEFDIHEYDREFVIQNGLLHQVLNHDNRKTKVSIYREQPEVLLRFWLATLNWELIEQHNVAQKKVVLLRFVADESGTPTQIEVLRGVNQICDAEIIKALEKLPEWDRYYLKGKLYELKWNIPVQLNKSWYLKQLERREE